MVKSILRHLLTSSLIILIYQTGIGQSYDLKEIKRIALNFSPISVSLDKQNHIFLGSIDGTIQKLDSEGELLSTFSPTKRAKPTIIEAWQGLRVFVYYENTQEYVLLNRFLSNENREIASFQEMANFSGLVTLGNGDFLWYINEIDKTLYKVELNNKEVILENNLNFVIEDDNFDVNFIRAYQNFVFIGTSNGIYQFDNFGNLIEKITDSESAFFSFYKNELVYILKETIHVLDLSSKKEREIRLPNLSSFALMENNQIVTIAGDTLIFHELIIR